MQACRFVTDVPITAYLHLCPELDSDDFDGYYILVLPIMITQFVESLVE